MTAHQKQHDKEFKMDAIRYTEEHPELTKAECARNLGIGLSTLTHWKHQYRLNNGDIPVRGASQCTGCTGYLKKAISILGKN